MIAIRENLPLIEHESGRTDSIEREWQLRSKQRAGRKCGFAQWWLAEHVAESVTEYLRTQTEWNVLPIAQ
jgi:hypothetical protein